jgi:type II secretory pathway pseudopilin PulG
MFASLRTRKHARRCESSAGETLIEVLIALVVLGIAAAALMAAFATGVRSSGIHRRVTLTDIDARNFVESLTTAIDTSTSSSTFLYTPCAPTSAYSAPPGFSPLAGDTVSVTSVEYWTGAAFASMSGCTTANDTGVQRVTFQVTNANASASRSVQVVIRKHCLVADVTAGPCS